MGLHTDREMGLGAGRGPMLQDDGRGPGTCSGLGARADGMLRQPCQLPLWASPSPCQESEYGQATGVGLGRASLPSRDLASAGCPGWDAWVIRVDRVERITQNLGLGLRTGRRVVRQCGDPEGRADGRFKAEKSGPLAQLAERIEDSAKKSCQGPHLAPSSSPGELAQPPCGSLKQAL